MIINQVKLKAVSIVSFPDQLFHSRWITSPLRLFRVAVMYPSAIVGLGTRLLLAFSHSSLEFIPEHAVPGPEGHTFVVRYQRIRTRFLVEMRYVFILHTSASQ